MTSCKDTKLSGKIRLLVWQKNGKQVKGKAMGRRKFFRMDNRNFRASEFATLRNSGPRGKGKKGAGEKCTESMRQKTRKRTFSGRE